MTISQSILPANTQLPKFSSINEGFSVISYNILLPNSEYAWWVYKYYQSSTPFEHREWLYRQGLLKKYFLEAEADIVCLQEVDGDTFDEYFSFLAEAGYDHVLHRKYHFRNATFWRRDKLELVEVQHKDRVLVSVLRAKGDEKQYLYVVNCHLTAGAAAPDRRLRQIFEALDKVRKGANKLGDNVANIATIVCGDFNSSSDNTAVRRLLFDGELDPSFREDDYPDVRITSKLKRQAFGSFVDAYEHVYGRNKKPATLLLPLLYARFINEVSGELQPKFVEAINSMFAYFSQGAEIMDQAAVNMWISKINGEPKRGHEYNQAVKIFANKGVDTLSFSEFLSIYENELQCGRFWGVHHDMQVCDVGIESSSFQPFEGYFDYVYYTNLNLLSVREPLNDEQKRLVYEKGDVLPNSWHPSDHLPLAVAFTWTGGEN